jgi:hypothetical protein
MYDAIYERCLAAYRRECDREGAIFQQPSGGGEWLDEEAGIFTLSNVRGTLATYQVDGDEVDGFNVTRIPNEEE